jgi:hypothetical protein
LLEQDLAGRFEVVVHARTEIREWAAREEKGEGQGAAAEVEQQQSADIVYAPAEETNTPQGV